MNKKCKMHKENFIQFYAGTKPLKGNFGVREGLKGKWNYFFGEGMSMKFYNMLSFE
jgi:hypothetical protein